MSIRQQNVDHWTVCRVINRMPAWYSSHAALKKMYILMTKIEARNKWTLKWFHLIQRLKKDRCQMTQAHRNQPKNIRLCQFNGLQIRRSHSLAALRILTFWWHAWDTCRYSQYAICLCARLNRSHFIFKLFYVVGGFSVFCTLPIT